MISANREVSPTVKPANFAAEFRSFLANVRRVPPYAAEWRPSDNGLVAVAVVEISRRSPDQRFSLAERIEKIGHALTASHLAELLNISRVTIFKHAAAGRIPSFRIGTSVRFDPRAVAEWLRNQ